MRDALVQRELDALGVDEDHADLVGRGPHEDREIIELTNDDLPAPVAPATSRWGIFARFATT